MAAGDAAWFDGRHPFGSPVEGAMALLTCVDCGGRVSSRAPACPHCGCPSSEFGGTAAEASAPPPTAVSRPPLASSLPRTAGAPTAGEQGPEAASTALPLELTTVAGLSSIVVDQPVTLGRSRANIIVEHQDVAPTHCRLVPNGEHWEIEDLGGLGLFLGTTKVAQATLGAGEVVDIGGFPGAVSIALPCSLGAPLPLRLRQAGGLETALVLQKLPMTMGRASWVDLPLADRNVSHAHARLRLEKGRVVLDDLQSRNGTFVGTERVKTGHALRLGDHIRMGETELVFGELPVPRNAPPTPVAGTAAPDPSVTPREMPDVVIPKGLTLEQLAGPADKDAHVVPEPPHHATQILPAGDGLCPACGETFDLRRGGVITGAYHVARTAIGVVGQKRSQARIGRCSCCGARLALCPECGVANAAPSLLERILCRQCDTPFSAA